MTRRLPMLLATFVLMTTEVEGCDEAPTPDPLPPVGVAAAEREVTEKLEAEPLGPFTLVCEAVSHAEYIQDHVDCAVERRGRDFRLRVSDAYRGSDVFVTLSTDEDDVAQFVEDTVALAGQPAARAACHESDDGYTFACKARPLAGGLPTYVRVVPRGYFYTVTLEPPGEVRATAVGGGPLVSLDLRSVQGRRIDLTVRGTARPGPGTDTSVTEVCAWIGELDELATCVAPGSEGRYEIPLRSSRWTRSVGVRARDAADATTELQVPLPPPRRG